MTEQPLHTFTRDALTGALTRLELRVQLTGPIARMINAESMADAIIEALSLGAPGDRTWPEEIPPELAERAAGRIEEFFGGPGMPGKGPLWDLLPYLARIAGWQP